VLTYGSVICQERSAKCDALEQSAPSGGNASSSDAPDERDNYNTRTRAVKPTSDNGNGKGNPRAALWERLLTELDARH
jgi:hypothetical protein